MKKYFGSGSFLMGRSGKGIQNIFFFGPGSTDFENVWKTCGFIVFKILVKTVNRKSLMVHVFTSVYGFLFSFLSLTEFNNSLNWILKSNLAQIDRAQNPIFQSKEYTNNNTHHLQNVLIQLFDSPTPSWAKQKCKESVTLSQRICDRFHKEFTHAVT